LRPCGRLPPFGSCPLRGTNPILRCERPGKLDTSPAQVLETYPTNAAPAIRTIGDIGRNPPAPPRPHTESIFRKAVWGQVFSLPP